MGCPRWEAEAAANDALSTCSLALLFRRRTGLGEALESASLSLYPQGRRWRGWLGWNQVGWRVECGGKGGVGGRHQSAA